MADEAPDILLIPGFMLDRDLWSDMRPDLERMGRVMDADTTRDDTIMAMAGRAIASLSRPAIVIGFSMGGYVAREIVYQAPHLVCGLALVATSSRGDDPKRSLKAADAAGFQTISRSAVMRSLHPDHRTDEMIERVQNMSRRLGGEAFSRQARLQRRDDTARLSEIGYPTLVVAAAQDELRSVVESEALRRNIPSAVLTIIEESGHLIPLERPRALVAALVAQFKAP